MQPASRPTTGTHRRSRPWARKASPTMTSSVAPALTGAAAALASFGTSLSMSKMSGITVTAMSMMTVPATVGVMILRTHASRAAKPNWNSAEMSTSVASMAGPPSASAVTLTAMNAPEVPMTIG